MVRAAAVVLAVAGSLAPAAALAADRPSAVFHAEGLDAATIIQRATACTPRFATSGLTTAPTIVTSDPTSGFLQARNFIAAANFAPAYRTTVTVEAKDGRFRISHEAIEVQLGRSMAPVKVMPAAFAVELNAQSGKIAACIRTGPVGDDF